TRAADSRRQASQSIFARCFAPHARAYLFCWCLFPVFPLRRGMAVAFQEIAGRTALSARHRRAEANELDLSEALQPPSLISLESRGQPVAASSGLKCHRNRHCPSLAR